MVGNLKLTGRIVGGGLGEVLPESVARERLDRLATVIGSEEWAASELLKPRDLAARLGVPRTSIDNWRRSQKIFSFRNGGRNYVYPIRQFERKVPIEGLQRLRKYFDADDTAWDWMVTPNRFTGGIEPIEWLRQGEVNDVVRAAEGGCDYQ